MCTKSSLVGFKMFSYCPFRGYCIFRMRWGKGQVADYQSKGNG